MPRNRSEKRGVALLTKAVSYRHVSVDVVLMTLPDGHFDVRIQHPQGHHKYKHKRFAGNAEATRAYARIQTDFLYSDMHIDNGWDWEPGDLHA